MNKKARLIALLIAAVLVFCSCSIKYDDISKGDGYTVSSLCDEDYVFDIDKQDEDKFLVWFFYMPSTADEKTGDCYLLRTPEDKYLLVDGGYDKNAESVIEQIKKIGIDKIDCCLLSHAHVDHVQGLPKLIETFDIDTIYMADVNYSSNPVKRLEDVIENRQMDVVYLKEGDSFMFSQSVKMQVFNPPEKIFYPKNGSKLTTANLNDSSLVLRATYGESSMLMVGDIYITGEVNIIKNYKFQIKSDLLKVAHHGSETSSGITFINAVNPIMACIINNQMASTRVYATYKNKCESVMHTGLDGTCKVRFDDKRNYECFTSKQR